MKVKTARLAGENVALDLFLAMLNPRNRGTSFKWETFPEMAGRWAYKSCFHFFNRAIPTEQEMGLAEQAAIEWSKYALERAGLVDK